MQPWEAEHIDNIFKQAAANTSFPYQADHWRAMDVKLIAAKKAAILVKAAIIGSIALVIAIATYLVLTKNLISSDEEVPGTQQNEMGVASDVTSNQMPVVGDLVKDEGTTTDNDIDPVSSTSPVNNGISGKPTITKPVDQLITGAASDRGTRESKPPLSSDNYPTDMEAVRGTDEQKSLHEDSYDHIHARTSKWPESRFYGDNPDNEMLVLDVVQPAVKNGQGRFEIGLSLAPDFTGVDFKGNRPGYGIGVVAGYKLSQRLSILSGIFYGKKVYEINEGYKPYNGIWQHVQEPDLIKANCDVFEIPVNLRLDVVSSLKNKVFISTGLSTYFMNREDYRFFYSNEGPNAIPRMEARGENRHFFGIYNLSLGIERKLTDRFGLQIEPYLKIPVSDIGLGRVNLTSSGTLVTAKYYFR